jgi:hypothetical protein
MKNDYSEFFLSFPDKTIMNKMCIKIRHKFSFTLMFLLTFLLVAATFSFWYLEMQDLDQAKPAVYQMLH